MLTNEPAPQQIIRVETVDVGGVHPKLFAIESDQPSKVWLFKPNTGAQVAIDVAASRTASASGIPSPSVYQIKFTVGRRLYEGSVQPYVSDVIGQEVPRLCHGLDPRQLSYLQEHQVLDWLLGNTDTHRWQFLLLRDGSIIGIDKAQSLRIFPDDVLEWDPPLVLPNNRRSAYRHLLWAERAARAARRNARLLDPAVAFTCADRLTGIDSNWLKSTWYRAVSLWPVHRLCEAVGARRLRTDADTAAAVEQVLDALVDRKNNLRRDFEQLYRQKSGGFW